MLARLGAIGQPAAQAVMEEWASRNQGILLGVLTWAAKEVRALEKASSLGSAFRRSARRHRRRATWQRCARTIRSLRGQSFGHSKRGAALYVMPAHLAAVPEPNMSPNLVFVHACGNINSLTHSEKTTMKFPTRCHRRQ